MKKQIAQVIVSATDLRNGPIAAAGGYQKDPLQESQLLFGDCVEVLSHENGWASVLVPDQPRFNQKKGWESYPGFIRLDHLAFIDAVPPFNDMVRKKWTTLIRPDGSQMPLFMGTRLKVELQDENHLTISFGKGQTGQIEKGAVVAEDLFCHLGAPYLWGGLTSYYPSLSFPMTGLDCSGLVFLYFRLKGMTVPRNASCQARHAKTISVTDLLPYDLIFRKDVAKERIDHVMFYLGKNEIFESTMKSRSVRRVSAIERLGTSIENITPEYSFEGGQFSFGRIT